MRFPKNPALREIWVATIIAQTPDYPGKKEKLAGMGLHLCIKHFEPSILIRKFENGIFTYALKKGGAPTIFNNIQEEINGSHPEVMDIASAPLGDDEILICYETSTTTSTDEKNGIHSDLDIVQIEDSPKKTANSSPTVKSEVLPQSEMLTSSEPVSKNDFIESVQDFISSLKLKDDTYYQPWRVTYNETSVLFALFDEDCKYLIQSFHVDENLITSVYYHGQRFTDIALTEVLGQDLKLDTWTKFKKLVLLLHTLTSEKQHHSMQLKHACHLLKNCIETGPQFGCSTKDIKKWKFLLNQLQFSSGEQQNFSADNLEWAIHAYSVNKPGYAKIYESDVITLPHPATLELFKRQAMQQASKLLQQQKIIRLQQPVSRFQPQQQFRPKVLQRTPAPRLIAPAIGNGLNPPNLGKLSHISATSSKTSVGQNGVSSSNGPTIEEIEIPE